ncbi:hypothetical protein ACFQNE_03045 [Gordonia phosphorivorans]|uniref:NurA domain-containing protein n=1 Tax=Gordonia phosphorivorans TaxID=1056982 RepID=A0ABV6H3X8_9ACTN
MQFQATLAAAERLLGGSARRGTVLAAVNDLLGAQSSIREVRATAGSVDPLLCVDGAVISAQSDVVTWISVAATNSDRSFTRLYTAVTPVGSHVDAVKAALMAAAELQAAVRTAGEVGEVWMDGSLATPLIALATSLPAVPVEAAAEFAVSLDDLEVVDSVAAYVRLAEQGRLRALPKQDTARAFVDQWAEQLDESAGRWLTMQRDRAVLGAVLQAGTCVMARTAPEVAAVEVSPAKSARLQSVQEQLAAAMGPWRHTSPHVAYVMPKHLDRPIKYEWTMPADSEEGAVAEVGVELAGRLDPLCRGPRMLEPLPQYVVDRHAKESVRYVHQLLMDAVGQQLGARHPELARSYRS